MCGYHHPVTVWHPRWAAAVVVLVVVSLVIACEQVYSTSSCSAVEASSSVHRMAGMVGAAADQLDG